MSFSGAFSNLLRSLRPRGGPQRCPAPSTSGTGCANGTLGESSPLLLWINLTWSWRAAKAVAAGSTAVGQGGSRRGDCGPRVALTTPSGLQARSVDARWPGFDGSGQRMQSSPDEPELRHHTEPAVIP
ncbi:hypothetical protein PAL_GLEAN10017671 [Pteropus alecto]|uniref:Uncharacterized protein n=1 Tax=Pteropus alecto TaxID=9402 RepID=L5KXQ7_PTEAL|nr:hypothetical protein PAL_GLEAN10017671 [Pteropus alecto]